MTTVNNYGYTISQTANFLKINSGFANVVTPALGNTFNVSQGASGMQYLNQTLIASGGTQSYNFVSGGLQDLVGNTVNFAQELGLTVMPASGAIQLETSQSGGLKLPQMGLSGGGILVNPGGVFAIGESYSGIATNLSAANGNLVARAVSGPCLLNIGLYGI